MGKKKKFQRSEHKNKKERGPAQAKKLKSKKRLHGKDLIKAADRTIEGEFKMHRDGYGFLLSEETDFPDVFIPPSALMGALNGDRIKVAAFRDSQGRYDGKVIKILQRGNKEIVGHFRYEAGAFYVLSSQIGGKGKLLIAAKNRKSAKDGQIVVAEIIEYEQPPQGRILRILGEGGSIDAEEESIILKFGLEEKFSEPINAEAESLTQETWDLSTRVDLREIPLVTIDGESARDFDDAICVKKEGKNFRLWVSIADVSHFVREKSLLDQEAFKRGNSTYFPQKCIPMLPEAISNNLCSLVPNEDRLTFTCEVLLSPQAKILEVDLYRSVIHSHARLTYTWVNQAIIKNDSQAANQYAGLVPMLKDAVSLAKKLRKLRLDRGTIDFDLPEPQFVFGSENETLDIIKSERNFAHMMIEEFMILANEAVARLAEERKLGFIFRIHEAPDSEKISDLNRFVRNLGYQGRLRSDSQSGDFAKIADWVRGKPAEKVVNHLMLRSMKQAIYCEENRGHFGLASESYTHFTSPIRRYSDLVVHRILSQLLLKNGRLRKKIKDQKRYPLNQIALQCSKRERNSMEAEWEVLDLKRALFMKDKVGNQYHGHICRVTKFGFFVELNDFFVEGLVHVTNLDDDYYEFDPQHHHLIGRRHKMIYKIGMPIEIIVDEVKIDEREIRFWPLVVEEKKIL